MDIDKVRAAFPMLGQSGGGRPIVYADNAATSLKPRAVNDAVSWYNTTSTSNIHRAKHYLSQEVSLAFEDARQAVARFLHCANEEVVFTPGTTAAINLVADGMVLQADDNVVGTVLEHHSNILPWSSRCKYRLAPLDAVGLPDIDHARRLIDKRTRLLAVSACSNVTGVFVPIERWIALAHEHGLPILIDAAQLIAHRPVDVTALDCDFLVFSGHKMCAPTGSGVLFGKASRLGALRVRNLGGGAVSLVNADGTFELRDLPWRFESGTPDIAAILGMKVAIDHLVALGMAEIEERNQALRYALLDALGDIPGIIGYHPPRETPAACIFSFREKTNTLPPDYLSRMLSDSYGIMARSGHQCAHPLHGVFGVSGTLRLSFQFYNTIAEIQECKAALDKLLQFV